MSDEERAVPVNQELVKANERATEKALSAQREQFHIENPGESAPGQVYRMTWKEGQWEKIFGKKDK